MKKVTGYASVYGNTDLQGDRVVPGAFDRSLSDTGGRVLVLRPAQSRHQRSESRTCSPTSAVCASAAGFVLKISKARDEVQAPRRLG